MPTAAFANLGCKVNQYETDKMIESFARRGFDIGEFDQPADVYVINSCSVTSAADRKSRYMARRASRQKDGAKVVLTGCFAQLAIDTGELVEGASLLVPNRDKMRIADHTLAAFPDILAYTASPAQNTTFGIAVFPEQAGLIGIDSVAMPKGMTHTRATLKVQDGCEHFCAFCSIPYTRNTMASRPLPDVLREATEMATRGIREIVVTGVCVGAYEDSSTETNLAGLMELIARVPGLDRIRLSSLQPIETDEALIDTLVRNPNICPHLHLSLQSGDDTVLGAMQRPYKTQYFRELVHRLRSRLPDIALTTDIIVGFPGETRELFENTLRFAEEMRFSRAHIFRYSPRERTFAEREFKDDVPYEEKERRHKELGELCRKMQVDFAGGYVGKSVDVLLESRGKSAGMLAGYTDTYLRVHVPVNILERGKMVTCKITEVTEDGDTIGKIEASGIHP